MKWLALHYLLPWDTAPPKRITHLWYTGDCKRGYMFSMTRYVKALALGMA